MAVISSSEENGFLTIDSLAGPVRSSALFRNPAVSVLQTRTGVPFVRESRRKRCKRPQSSSGASCAGLTTITSGRSWRIV